MKNYRSSWNFYFKAIKLHLKINKFSHTLDPSRYKKGLINEKLTIQFKTEFKCFCQWSLSPAPCSFLTQNFSTQKIFSHLHPRLFNFLVKYQQTEVIIEISKKPSKLLLLQFSHIWLQSRWKANVKHDNLISAAARCVTCVFIFIFDKQTVKTVLFWFCCCFCLSFIIRFHIMNVRANNWVVFIGIYWDANCFYLGTLNFFEGVSKGEFKLLIKSF